MKTLFLILLFCSTLHAIRLSNSYENEADIRKEFINMDRTKAELQIPVFNSTPSFSKVTERQLILYSSGPLNKFMIFIGTKPYMVEISSI
mgnify:CR=1 FL=1